MRVILLSLSFLLCQCGYNWGHQTRALPGGHRTVYVEMFKNQTREIGLESQFSQALTKELERSGFAIVTSKESAELILQGTVISAGVAGSGSDPSFVAKDFSNPDPNLRSSRSYSAPFFTVYTLNVAVSVEAVRSRDKQRVWQTTMSGSKSYQGARLKRQGLRSSNVLYNQARKKQTIKLVAQEMMSNVFDRLTENF